LQFIDKFAFWLRRATLSQTHFKPVWRLASWGHLSILGQGSIGLGCIIEKGHINQPLQTALLNAARRSVQGVSDQYLGI
jgi:hypothetical protein